jgi:hypothetical protein
MLKTQEILELLKLVAKADYTDAIWWTCDNDELQFLVNCNDIFYWGCADAEEISTTEDFALFEQSYRDCIALDSMSYDWPLLYCARKRNMRPQGTAYSSQIRKEVHELFNAAGPEREINFGNPQSQDGDYLYQK